MRHLKSRLRLLLNDCAKATEHLRESEDELERIRLQMAGFSGFFSARRGLRAMADPNPPAASRRPASPAR